MTASQKDPTDPIRLKASRYPGVVKGTSCTQSSFKTPRSAFLYVGTQGGRYKAMFKLAASAAEAAGFAARQPDRYEVGSTAWVTARFTAEEPMPQKLWEKWLDESYELSLGGGAAKKPAVKKAGAKRKASRKGADAKTRRT